MKTTTIALLIAGLFSAQAMAGNKPLHGRYLCKGTETQEINIRGVGAGSKSASVKGRLTASRGSFMLFVTTPGWQSIISGYLEPDLQKATWSASNRANKEIARGCTIGYMWQTGTATQNKKGRSVTINVEQAYYCGWSDAESVDSYRVTCKR